METFEKHLEGSGLKNHPEKQTKTTNKTLPKKKNKTKQPTLFFFYTNWLIPKLLFGEKGHSLIRINIFKKNITESFLRIHLPVYLQPSLDLIFLN